jgi:hypothetical protein
MNRRSLRLLAGVFAMSLLFGCAPRKEVKVLIQMIKQQENYFISEVVPEFEQKYKVKIQVIHMDNVDSIENELDKYKKQVVLVKIPFSKSWALVKANRIKDLNSFLTQADLQDLGNTFLLTTLGQNGGRQYLIPRKFETRVMVYRKSKVADAVATWRTFKDSLDAVLKLVNGRGLPATYTLEENPNDWDYYDVFVAGWVWAHTPYDGKTMARVANRGKRYSGTGLTVVDRVFQCNGDSTNVLRMEGDPVVDAYMWESLYAACGVYNKRMWEEEWSGTDIWKGYGTGDVFLSFMTQLDCFFIHGTGRDSLQGYLTDPDDMGVATMPTGCSVELDNGGAALRPGRKSITTGGWWWGIPMDSPDLAVSYALARHITGTKNQIQECSRFGMIPVRKDILGDMSMMFGGGWITQVYEASFNQLTLNKSTVIPANAAFDKINGVYIDAWYDIVVGKNWSVDKKLPLRDFVSNVLSSKYAPAAQTYLMAK